MPLQWKCGVLTTGPLGKSWKLFNWQNWFIVLYKYNARWYTVKWIDSSFSTRTIYLLSSSAPMSFEGESEVAQSCLTLCGPMDYSLSGFSIHGIFQARVLEWVLFPSPGGLPTQELNPHFLHCRQTLYPLSHQGSPNLCFNYPLIVTSPFSDPHFIFSISSISYSFCLSQKNFQLHLMSNTWFFCMSWLMSRRSYFHEWYNHLLSLKSWKPGVLFDILLPFSIIIRYYN